MTHVGLDYQGWMSAADTHENRTILSRARVDALTSDWDRHGSVVCVQQVFCHLESGAGERVVTVGEDKRTVEAGGAKCTFAHVFTEATAPGAESVYAAVSDITFVLVYSHACPAPLTRSDHDTTG